MLRHTKRYKFFAFGFTFDEFTELVYAVKITHLIIETTICEIPVTVSNRLDARQSEIFTELIECKTKLLFLGSLDISKEIPNTFNRFD